LKEDDAKYTDNDDRRQQKYSLYLKRKGAKAIARKIFSNKTIKSCKLNDYRVEARDKSRDCNHE